MNLDSLLLRAVVDSVHPVDVSGVVDELASVHVHHEVTALGGSGLEVVDDLWMFSLSVPRAHMWLSLLENVFMAVIRDMWKSFLRLRRSMGLRGSLVEVVFAPDIASSGILPHFTAPLLPFESSEERTKERK